MKEIEEKWLYWSYGWHTNMTILTLWTRHTTMTIYTDAIDDTQPWPTWHHGCTKLIRKAHPCSTLTMLTPWMAHDHDYDNAMGDMRSWLCWHNGWQTTMAILKLWTKQARKKYQVIAHILTWLRRAIGVACYIYIYK